MCDRSRILVIGPAYLDRVLEVAEPLHDPRGGLALDQSVRGMRTGNLQSQDRLRLVDPRGRMVEIEPPPGWPGPCGWIELDQSFGEDAPGFRSIRGSGWRDDLGGMGAGFAAALGGRLVPILGSDSDEKTRMIREFLDRNGIPYSPLVVPHAVSEWTLLVSSGEHGDKLAIGFRGCCDFVEPQAIASAASARCELRVVAGVPNPLAAAALAAPGAVMRLFAPSLRNMNDSETPIARFAGDVDLLCCNRREWEQLADREEVAWKVSILVVTDGPRGSLVRFTRPDGEPGFLEIPAFPRARPPRDTNRAGEAFAASFVATLLAHRWGASSGVAAESLIREAMLRAAAAAALVLDHKEFGFPVPCEIDAALAKGRID
jgi:sugar/nucleoside kinase (ribokinase family)